MLNFAVYHWDKRYMPNPQPRTEYLKPILSPWKHTPTKRLRFPACFEQELIDYANYLDGGGYPLFFSGTKDKSLSDQDIELLVRQHFKVGHQSKTAKQARQFAKAILEQVKFLENQSGITGNH